MRSITNDDLDRLAIGAGILGTGGGGNPYTGKVLAKKLLAEGHEIKVVTLDEVPDDALVTSTGDMGAPVVGFERLQNGNEQMWAVQALEERIGKKFTHIIPSEIGGGNSVAPMIPAALTGLPLIDGDGMGRAFPELQMDTFMIYGIPAAPGAIADPRGHVAIFDGFADPVALERYARPVTVAMGGSAGYAFPVMTGAETKKWAVPDTLSLAIAIGDAVMRARADHSNAADAVLAVTGGQRLFTGKIGDVERRLQGGFSRGVLKIEGDGPDRGATVKIDFQNENLIARRDDGEVLAVVPDLICIIDQDTGEPITTELLRYGLRVTVLGIPATELLKTPEALRYVGPAAFGYPDVPYVPLPGTYGVGNAS